MRHTEESGCPERPKLSQSNLLKETSKRVGTVRACAPEMKKESAKKDPVRSRDRVLQKACIRPSATPRQWLNPVGRADPEEEAFPA